MFFDKDLTAVRFSVENNFFFVEADIEFDAVLHHFGAAPSFGQRQRECQWQVEDLAKIVRQFDDNLVAAELCVDSCVVALTAVANYVGKSGITETLDVFREISRHAFEVVAGEG